MSTGANPLAIIFNPPVPPNISPTAHFQTIVTLPSNGGAWPHRHEIREHPHHELEAYCLTRGSMTVWMRNAIPKDWKRITLTVEDPWVLIPPGFFHGILAGPEGAVFVTLTMPAHLIGNDAGGNVHRLPIEHLPEEFRQRINESLIK